MCRSKAIFDQMTTSLNTQGTEMVRMGGAVFQVVISDAGDEGKFTLDLKNGSAFAHFPQCEVAKADCTITMADKDFVAMAQGKLDGMAALAKGKCRIKSRDGLSAWMLFQKFQGILQDPLFLWPMSLHPAN
jgi:alkyl sulfatase BDS1-like metallo-beta-lactamase superfamily hydrolase